MSEVTGDYQEDRSELTRAMWQLNDARLGFEEDLTADSFADVVSWTNKVYSLLDAIEDHYSPTEATSMLVSAWNEASQV